MRDALDIGCLVLVFDRALDRDNMHADACTTGRHHLRDLRKRQKRHALEERTDLGVLFKLLLLPLVMGISYELLKWCGRSDNLATRIIRQPGIWVQHLTVFEPDDSMIEVAIAAVTPVLPENPEEGKW